MNRESTKSKQLTFDGDELPYENLLSPEQALEQQSKADFIDYADPEFDLLKQLPTWNDLKLSVEKRRKLYLKRKKEKVDDKTLNEANKTTYTGGGKKGKKGQLEETEANASKEDGNTIVSPEEDGHHQSTIRTDDDHDHDIVNSNSDYCWNHCFIWFVLLFKKKKKKVKAMKAQ
ncbi:hypothetical protein RFI_23332 [Reticulomyxa filosa]|uniref:Uncharacterized protein n=1 Tax=Reticulomyxa filosa TaxID=46433 RepID=X6MLS9_RETFI|nr:hypothetical protein RFI_23332 [Reticulomyxa filosa]|eukprot:ETO14035.1 hypothetical protein RFI_23332 [Reticulomyxa filosa]